MADKAGITGKLIAEKVATIDVFASDTDPNNDFKFQGIEHCYHLLWIEIFWWFVC